MNIWIYNAFLEITIPLWYWCLLTKHKRNLKIILISFYSSIKIFMITFHYFNSLIITKNVNYFNSLIQITHRKEKVESYCVLSDHRQFSWECSASQDSQFGFSILIKMGRLSYTTKWQGPEFSSMANPQNENYYDSVPRFIGCAFIPLYYNPYRSTSHL